MELNLMICVNSLIDVSSNSWFPSIEMSQVWDVWSNQTTTKAYLLSQKYEQIILRCEYNVVKNDEILIALIFIFQYLALD